jgi:hypothetical protein
MRFSLSFTIKQIFYAILILTKIPYFTYSCFEGREESKAKRYKNSVYTQKQRNIRGKGHKYVILMRMINK